jgi:hypothetical protein
MGQEVVMPVVHVDVAELLGNFADNDCLRRIAMKLEDEGDSAQALAILQALEGHITSHPGDLKSTVWLLPDVKARVARLSSTGVSSLPASPKMAQRGAGGESAVTQGMEATVVRWLLRASFLQHAVRYLSLTIGSLIADVQPAVQNVGPVVNDAIKALVIGLVQILTRGPKS